MEVVLLVGDVFIERVELHAGVGFLFHPGIVSDIEDARGGLGLGLPGLGFALFGEFGNAGFGIVEIAEDESVGGAVVDASRFHADVGAVLAEVALLGDFLFHVDGNGAVGAGFDAFFFEVTARFIDEDASVVAFLDGFGRTSFEAGGIDTVHANERGEGDLFVVRLLKITNAHTEVSERNIVFCFTRNAA